MRKSVGTIAARLERTIRRHNKLYFELNQPEISDYEFDRLIEQLRKIKPDSAVLSEIPPGVVSKEFKKVRHQTPMLSLNKCYREEDLDDWMNKFEGDLVASPKIDGCATELRYNEKGELVLGATRGDGREGEEITANVRMIRDIPQKIPRGPVEIRGEIYMRLPVFRTFQSTFANPRNLAAGAIKQKDPQKTKDYRLSFFGYDLLGLPLRTEWEKFEILQSFGIPTVAMRRLTREEKRETYDYFLKRRGEWDYETDGVVFKANLLAEQERLGMTAHHPRYAIAWKFQGDSGTTTLHDVEWSVARTGVITPVGIVEPVLLSGAMVGRVSLHHLGMMKRLRLRRGSKVAMMRRGGVIPNLESVLEEGKEVPFEAPRQCPSCGAATVVREDFLLCTNKEGCRQAKMEELEHFMKVIECDGFGRKLIEKLYDNGYVRDPADFYELKKEDLLELERMGEVLAAKLIGTIQTKRDLPVDLFLRSLGIRELAQHTSKLLARKFSTLEKILGTSEEELSSIHTIGPVIAHEVTVGLKKKRRLIEKLQKHVRVVTGQGRAPQKGPLQGKTVVFTGTLLSMTRSEARKLVAEKGGEALDHVTRDLDYLIVGDGGGGGVKLEKAKKLQAEGRNVRLLSEQEWKKLIS